MSPWYSFYLVLAIGLLLNVAFIVIFKSWWMKRQTLRTTVDAI